MISHLVGHLIIYQNFFPKKLSEIRTFLLNIIATANTNLEYIESLLYSIHHLLLKKTTLNHSDIPDYVDKIVPHLLAKPIASSLYGNTSTMQNVLCEESIIKIIAGIISVITQNLNIRYEIRRIAFGNNEIGLLIKNIFLFY